MRKPVTQSGLTVHAISGTYVVILAMNLSKAASTGLLGFAIHRTDHTEDEAYWLQGMKTFEATDPGFAAGARYSSREHPFQDFTWSDYSAKPDHKYTYRVVALKGTPQNLSEWKTASVTIETESPEGGDHDVYFNRGAAASQEYARRFGNRTPGSQGGASDPAWAWLSRGAHEAISEFIGQANGSSWGLRVCAYEFRLASVLETVRKAHLAGADVKILYDAGHPSPRDPNRAAVDDANIKSLCTERLPVPQGLSHNKFIVLLKNGTAQAVLTGSTNFSESGVFGHSNVVHIVQNKNVAADFLAYWETLRTNPNRNVMAPQLSAAYPLPANLPTQGTHSIFSPRDSLDAMQYYADRAAAAGDALFMTFAFGMNETFKAPYETGTAPLRYALMEKLLGPGIRKEKKAAETKRMIDICKMKFNHVAVGSQVSANKLDRWLGEELSGLSRNVKYIHTKYMLINPLSDDPFVVTGSANFSAASTNKNDENMLLIRGNKRVADIYLGEYMRLWDHYNFRGWLAKQKKPTLAQLKPWYLDPTDGWTKVYFGDTRKSRHREYFAG